MADDPNVTLFKQLYSKIAEGLSVGTPTAMPGQNYLTLCNPGILLDPALDPVSNANDQYTLASILNNVPEPNWVYTPTNITLWSIFQDVLSGKELPLVELTQAQKDQLAAATTVLMTSSGDETPQFKNYLKYQQAYYTALAEYQTAQATAANQGTAIPPLVQSKLNQAKANWNTFGFKGKVEAAQATVANLSQLDPNNWWSQLQNTYDAATVTAGSGTFEQTSTYPDYSWFVGDKGGWTTFSFNEQDVTKQATSTAVNAGGGVSAGWGLWRVSASADYSKETSFSSSDTTGVSVSFDMMRSTIVRPWLDPLVFRARTWRFGEGSPLHGDLISTGTFVPGEMPENTLMPLLLTGILVARNVVISGTFSHEDQTTAEQAISGGASVGYGPFSIQGHYSQSSSSSVSHGNVTGTAMANPDPQILGFFCDVLPLSPNPDPTLPWPG